MFPQTPPAVRAKVERMLADGGSEFAPHFEKIKYENSFIDSLFGAFGADDSDDRARTAYRTAAIVCYVVQESIVLEKLNESPWTEEQAFPFLPDSAITQSLLCVDVYDSAKRQKFVAELQRVNPSLHKFVDCLLSTSLKQLEDGDVTATEAIYLPMLHLIHTLAHSYAQWRATQGDG